VLISTAASIGVIHTVLAIDHYIPFAVMSKANNWGLAKTIRIVFVCGAGHVLATVLLGLVGIYLGTQLSFFIRIEEFRGEIAKWLLIAFGAVYMLIGVRSAIKNAPHKHLLSGSCDICHDHHETHEHSHSAAHTDKNGIPHSFWPLFVVMILGPCEFLIPLLLYPAAVYGAFSVAVIALVFSVCTIASMIICTVIALKGINMIPTKRLERYSHALTGLTILICGVLVHFLDI